MKLSLLLILAIFCQFTVSHYAQTLRRCVKSGIRSHNSKYHKFLKFIRKYNRNYKTSGECSRRLKNFVHNMKSIDKIRKTERGTAVYGVTNFADYSKKELKRVTGGKPPRFPSNVPVWQTPPVKIPEVWDWRKKNVVNPVVDQKKCGSCFAFGAVANIESMYAIKYGKLLKLSEQQIVDCDMKNQGCGGGKTFVSGEYAAKYGLMLSLDYPYVGYHQKCAYDSRKVAARILKPIFVMGDETQIAQYVYQKGPVTVWLRAYCINSYVKGIINNENCGGKSDHFMVVVGYGVSVYKNGTKLPYWILRNSWGPGRGERGYVRIVRNKGVLGVNISPVSYIV